jgi:hypothetical protein
MSHRSNFFFGQTFFVKRFKCGWRCKGRLSFGRALGVWNPQSGHTAHPKAKCLPRSLFERVTSFDRP